jgi:polyisoprenoid-binding protein YceI
VRRAIKGLIALLVLVLLAGAGFTAWYVFGSRVPGKPKVACGTSATGKSSQPAGGWGVARGANVYVGYRIHEVFGDALLKRDAIGRTPAVTGTLAISGNHVVAASLKADLTHLGSDREARDSYVRDTTLQTDRYPTARFTLSRPIALPVPAKKAVPVHVAAHGTLQLHGVTRPVTFELEACWNGPRINVVGSAPVTLADFHVKAPHTVIADVEDHGSIELDLDFVPLTS